MERVDKKRQDLIITIDEFDKAYFPKFYKKKKRDEDYEKTEKEKAPNSGAFADNLPTL